MEINYFKFNCNILALASKLQKILGSKFKNGQVLDAYLLTLLFMTLFLYFIVVLQTYILKPLDLSISLHVYSIMYDMNH